MQTIPVNRIDPAAVSYWRWSGLINSILICVIPLIYYGGLRIWDWPTWILTILILLAIASSVLITLVFPAIRWNTWRYDVSDEQIDLYYGVLIKHRTLIPMARVQHVDTQQGPLQRRYGLSTVSVSTAAGKHEIPALADGVAAQLRIKISELARLVDEDV